MKEWCSGLQTWIDRSCRRRAVHYDVDVGDFDQRSIDHIFSEYDRVLYAFVSKHGLPPWIDVCSFDPLGPKTLLPVPRDSWREKGFPVFYLIDQEACAPHRRLFLLDVNETSLNWPRDFNDEASDGAANKEHHEISAWDRLRPMITEYYVQNGLKLKEIRDLMADKFGHHATWVALTSKDLC